MNFIKGIMIGGVISAGIFMICNESMNLDKKKLMKKGKKILKKMGI